MNISRLFLFFLTAFSCIAAFQGGDTFDGTELDITKWQMNSNLTVSGGNLYSLVYSAPLSWIANTGNLRSDWGLTVEYQRPDGDFKIVLATTTNGYTDKAKLEIKDEYFGLHATIALIPAYNPPPPFGYLVSVTSDEKNSTAIRIQYSATTQYFRVSFRNTAGTWVPLLNQSVADSLEYWNPYDSVTFRLEIPAGTIVHDVAFDTDFPPVPTYTESEVRDIVQRAFREKDTIIDLFVDRLIDAETDVALAQARSDQLEIQLTNDNPIDLHAGWNLVSPGFDALWPETPPPNLRGKIWTWDGTRFFDISRTNDAAPWHQANTLVRGHGYWIFATGASQLQLLPK